MFFNSFKGKPTILSYSPFILSCRHLISSTCALDAIPLSLNKLIHLCKYSRAMRLSSYYPSLVMMKMIHQFLICMNFSISPTQTIRSIRASRKIKFCLLIQLTVDKSDMPLLSNLFLFLTHIFNFAVPQSPQSE